MKIIRLLLTLLCIVPMSFIGQNTNNKAIESLLKKRGLEGASISFQIKNLNNGHVVSQYNPNLFLTPASVQKIITTATALELLGPDYRYETILSYSGSIDQSGTLDGNLYIEGKGDPSLGSDFLSESPETFISEWIQEIKKLGIKRIAGNVITFTSTFDALGVSPRWLAEDLGSYYGAGSYGINVFDNRYTLYLKSGKEGECPQILYTSPRQTLNFINNAITTSTTGDSLYILGAPQEQNRHLLGIVPPHKEKIAIKGDISDPAKYLQSYIIDQLTISGIDIDKKQTAATDRQHLYTHYSRPLRDIIHVVNFSSHNLFADCLLKTLGEQCTHPFPGASSFDKGSLVISQFWNDHNIPLNSDLIIDGSGLAPGNKVSASLLNQVLEYIYLKSNYTTEFIKTVPQAGKEGSVRNFIKQIQPNVMVHLKSGSMGGFRVKSYTGYIIKNGNTYAISILLNNYTSSGREATAMLDRFFNDLIKSL